MCGQEVSGLCTQPLIRQRGLYEADSQVEFRHACTISDAHCFCALIQGGSIVMVASIAAYLPAPPIALYGVTKTAVVSLARSLANELGCEGIRVNAIAPGSYCIIAPPPDFDLTRSCG